MNDGTTQFWARQRSQPQVIEARLKAQAHKIRTGQVQWNLAYLRVLKAYLSNNKGGMRKDVSGRSYRFVCRKFGFDAMTADYLDGNSWGVR